MTDLNARPTRREQEVLDAIKREIAATPQEVFYRRLELIEASLDELVSEAGAHHAELAGKIESVSETARHQAKVLTAKIVTIQRAIQELQILVYGEPRYALDGLAAEVKQMSQMLETMQVERQGLRDRIKWMSLALVITLIFGGVTLVGVLVEFLR